MVNIHLKLDKCSCFNADSMQKTSITSQTWEHCCKKNIWKNPKYKLRASVCRTVSSKCTGYVFWLHARCLHQVNKCIWTHIRPLCNQVHPLAPNIWIWKLTAIRQSFVFLKSFSWSFASKPYFRCQSPQFVTTDCTVQTIKGSVLVLTGNRMMFPQHNGLSRQVYHTADLKLAVKEPIKFEPWFNRKLVNDSSAPITHKTGGGKKSL